MTRFFLILVTLALITGRSDGQTVRAEQIPPPFPIPAGEGMFRVASAEPLGRRGFSLRLLNEAYQIDVSEVGEGASVTSHLAMGFGLSNSIDFTMSVPLLFDIAGGLSKYGTGDLTTSIKLGFPGKFPASTYAGFELSAVHPFGFDKPQALNVREFTRGEREMAARFLLDINREAVGLRLNLGYLAQSGIRNTGLMFGGGLEVGRGQIFSATAEYLVEPSLIGDATERAVFGVRMNLWWLQFEAGIEQGFSPDLPEFSAIAGVRIQTNFRTKNRRTFGERIRRVPMTRDEGKGVKVAVVNLLGYEHEGAGQAIASHIKTALARRGVRLIHIEDDRTAFLDPADASMLAEQYGAEVVITGRVLRYEMSRASRPNLPLVIGFPETQAKVEADLRIVEQGGDVFSAQITGQGRKNRGVSVFPVTKDDRTSYLNVLERNQVWNEAIDSMVGGLMRQMSDNFGWFPG